MSERFEETLLIWEIERSFFRYSIHVISLKACIFLSATSPISQPYTTYAYVTASHFLRSRTPRAKFRSTATVVSQSMQASVMLTPFFRPARPLSVTFWFPPLRFDSIMTPTIPFSPAHSWSTMSFATSGWLLWSLRELPREESQLVWTFLGKMLYAYHASNRS